MMKILIDSTDRYIKTVSLFNNDIKVDFLEGDIDITSAISELLIKHNLKPSDIDKYESNTGPGSYTGIRIGLAVSNILNWALQNPQKYQQVPNYGSEPNITPRKKPL